MRAFPSDFSITVTPQTHFLLIRSSPTPLPEPYVASLSLTRSYRPHRSPRRRSSLAACLRPQFSTRWGTPIATENGSCRASQISDLSRAFAASRLQSSSRQMPRSAQVGCERLCMPVLIKFQLFFLL